MRKNIIVVFLLLILLLPLTVVKAQPKQITPQNLIDEIVEKLDNIKDFKGTVMTEVYSNDETINSRTQIMKSETRSMTRDHGDTSVIEGEKGILLNSIPWIYLPPDYEVIKSALPLAPQQEYKNPLKMADQLYDLKLLGEGTYRSNQVYIIELENSFSTQRLYIDKEHLTIRKIDVFNGSNIKVASISYSDFNLFADEVRLPTKITVSDSIGQPVLEINYQDWQVNLGLTNFDFLQGFEEDQQSKINKLQKQLVDGNQNDEVYYKLSNLYQNNGNISRAISSLQQAIDINDRIKYRKELAALYRKQGSYEKALEELNSALQLSYDNAEAHYLLGELQLQLGNINQARQYLERATSYDKKNERYLDKLFWVYNNLANKNDDEYMLERAEKTAKKLIEIDPENNEYRIYLGDISLKLGKTIKAAEAYHQAIDLDPKDTWGYIKLANYYQEMKNYQKSEEIYRYVLNLEDSLENHRRLGEMYFEQHKYELAVKEYQIVAERSAADTEMKLKLAETYVAVGKVDEALKIFNEVLNEQKVEQSYSKIIEIVNNYESKTVLSLLEQLLEENKQVFSKQEQEDLNYHMSMLYFQQVKEEQQRKTDELISLKSEAELYSYLGQTSFSAGDLKNARDYFKKALAEYPMEKDYYNLAVSYLLMDEFSLARTKAEQLIDLGLSEQGQEIKSLSNSLAEWKKINSRQYVPGRLKLIKGNQLRQQGNLNASKVEYQAAITENQDYQAPYFYLAIIKTLENNAQASNIKDQVKEEELQLLSRLITVINEVKLEEFMVDIRSVND
ncbi:MAG: DUF4292 domain-containing protein [Bacillota bacterium]